MKKILSCLLIMMMVLSINISRVYASTDNVITYNGQTFDTPQDYLKYKEEEEKKKADEAASQQEEFYKQIAALRNSQEKTQQSVERIEALLATIAEPLANKK